MTDQPALRNKGDASHGGAKAARPDIHPSHAPTGETWDVTIRKVAATLNRVAEGVQYVLTELEKSDAAGFRKSVALDEALAALKELDAIASRCREPQPSTGELGAALIKSRAILARAEVAAHSPNQGSVTR